MCGVEGSEVGTEEGVIPGLSRLGGWGGERGMALG